MLKEDLPALRWVTFVVEGLILLPPESALRTLRDVVTKDVDRWGLDTRMVAHLWDIEWRTDLVIELATVRSRRTAEVFEERFARDYVPGEVRFARSWNALIDHTSPRECLGFFHNVDEDLGPKALRVDDASLFDAGMLDW